MSRLNLWKLATALAVALVLGLVVREILKRLGRR
jgi:hypothetical protein